MSAHDAAEREACARVVDLYARKARDRAWREPDMAAVALLLSTIADDIRARGAQRDGDDLRALATATWRALGETGDVPNRTAEIVYRARGVRAERDAAEAALADIAEAADVPYMGAQGLAGVVRLRVAALPSPAEASPAAAERGR